MFPLAHVDFNSPTMMMSKVAATLIALAIVFGSNSDAFGAFPANAWGLGTRIDYRHKQTVLSLGLVLGGSPFLSASRQIKRNLQGVDCCQLSFSSLGQYESSRFFLLVTSTCDEFAYNRSLEETRVMVL